MIKVLLVDDETMLLDSLEIILSMNGMRLSAKRTTETKPFAYFRACPVTSLLWTLI